MNSPHPTKAQLRVLIIDDSPTEATVISGVLEKTGMECLIAHSGEAGIEQAKLEQPDVILMDIVMPGLNGFQATRQLSRHPTTKDIPVIMVSTKGSDTDRIWAARQGAKDYIVKPVSEDALVGAIWGVLFGKDNAN